MSSLMYAATHPGDHSRSVLLLSGGHDSIALAAWTRPAACLTINYGQRPVAGEMRASKAAAEALNIPWDFFRVNLNPVGSGLLHDSAERGGFRGRLQPFVPPSPEWWPFRNQLLVSLAAAWALPRGFDRVLVGSVKQDGTRHRDGDSEFYDKLNEVVAYQEGGIQVQAPAADTTTVELIHVSNVTEAVLGYAHSCHVADYPCLMCPGCVKHEEVLIALYGESE